MDRVSYTVEGMTCEGCETSLVKALSALDSVSAARASYLSKVVDVDFAGGGDDDAVRAAVEDAGFDFVGRRGA